MSEQETRTTEAPTRRRKMRWVIAAVGILVVAGVGATVVLSSALAEPVQAPANEPDVATVKVRTTDLKEQETANGTVGYGPEHPVSGRRRGTVTDLPAAGDVLARGQQVYAVNEQPVPLFYGDIPLYRVLTEGVDNGKDVEMIERNLVALGFTGFGEPDTVFTWATARSVADWQESLGIEETGEIKPGDVVVRPGSIRVAKVSAQLGDQSQGTLLQVTGTARLVTAELKHSEKHIAEQGAQVRIELPDGTTTTGVIESVRPQSGGSKQQGSGQPDSSDEPKVDVLITVEDTKDGAKLDSVPVSVTFTIGSRQDVLAVPVGALLALREGGYALEVVDGNEHRLLAVETGLFAQGLVEVSGEGLRAGMTVVTTS